MTGERRKKGGREEEERRREEERQKEGRKEGRSKRGGGKGQEAESRRRRKEVSEFILNIFNGSGAMPGSILHETRPQHCFLPRQPVKQLTSCLLVGTDNQHGEDPGEEKHRCVPGEKCQPDTL